MERKIRALVQEYDMLPRGERVLCAVSGGRDSMCLLHILTGLQEELGFAVRAASFDHMLRPDSEEDCRFVADWCRQHSIPCTLGKGDVAAYAREHGLGVEESARELRYGFLRAAAEEQDCQVIATAHHAEDNAETVLLHLVRGSGLNGLGGIPPRRDALVRPLLTVTGEELEEYARANQIPWREDESNTDLRYRRNYIRREIMPRLKELNPNLTQTLTQTATSLRQDGAYLTARAQGAMQGVTTAAGSVLLPVETLSRQPEALAPRILQAAVDMLDPEIVLSAAQRRAVLELCRSEDPSGQCTLPKGLSAQRVYSQLVLSFPGRVEVLEEMALDFTGTRELGCCTVTVERGVFSRRTEDPGETFYLPDRPVTLRPRRTGDSVSLPGRPGKTLKKLFIEAKIPEARRALVPVLEQDGAVAAVVGFGTAVQAQCPKEAPCLKITIRHREEDRK